MSDSYFGLHSTDKSRFAFLFGLIAITYLAGMFNHHLIPSMEPRFAEVIKEMLAKGQYLVPIKNGWPYVEYPPLYYWLSLCGKAIGLSTEAAIRLPAYIALILWMLWLTRLCDALSDTRSSFDYALLGVAFPGILYQFFTAQSDSVLVLGVIIAFTGFVKRRVSTSIDGNKFSWELWFGVSLATAAKGPVGIACTLPIMVLEIFLCDYQQRKNHTTVTALLTSMIKHQLQLHWFKGIALLLLINLPWYIATINVYGWDFVRAVVVYQNVDRYLAGFSHQHPWWYYLVTLSYDMFPASLLLPVGMYYSWQRLSQFKYRLAFLWFGFTLLFFTVSASKQGKYMLPAAPAAVMLAFIAIDYWRGGTASATLWKIVRHGCVVLVLLWAIVVIGILPFYSDKIGAYTAHQKISAAIAQSPGKITHFQWPRSETLYYLGAPMDFVRSSRELYQRIHDGRIAEGDYVLVYRNYLAQSPSDQDPNHLIPAPAAPYLQLVLEVKSSRQMLYKVLPGAGQLPVPATPEPAPVFWRNQQFDTD